MENQRDAQARLQHKEGEARRITIENQEEVRRTRQGRAALGLTQHNAAETGHLGLAQITVINHTRPCDKGNTNKKKKEQKDLQLKEAITSQFYWRKKSVLDCIGWLAQTIKGLCVVSKHH